MNSDILLASNRPALITPNFGDLVIPFGPDGEPDLQACRSFIDPQDGQSKRVIVNTEGEVTGTVLAANVAGLQYDEWKDIDRTVLDVYTRRLVGKADLISRGLTHNLGSVGNTIAQWDKVGDMTPADINMSGEAAGEEDTPQYITDSRAVPVIHKDFRINWRRLEASRRFGESIDTTAARTASRLVAEAEETMLFSGNSIIVNGSQIYGYLTHPDRNNVTLTTPWTSATVTQIFADVQDMLQAARNDQRFGPFVLYVPTAYEEVLDEDYYIQDASPEVIVGGTRTIRERLLQLNGLQDIKVADFLTADNVVLVQMDAETVDWAEAQAVTTLQYTNNGGMTERFKVFCVGVPRVKSDYDGRCGIVHLS